MASAWSPDGRYVAFVRNPIADPGKNSLCIAPTFGDMKAYELIGPFGDVGGAAFSADGKWLAYHSNETGRSEVYIVAFPEPRRRVPVSSAGGLLPKWSSDGKELYYLAEDKTLMAATIQQGKNELSVSKTQALFKINGIIFGTVFDVSRDGKRFLVLKDAEEQPSSAITLIANWPQSLQK